MFGGRWPDKSIHTYVYTHMHMNMHIWTFGGKPMPCPWVSQYIPLPWRRERAWEPSLAKSCVAELGLTPKCMQGLSLGSDPHSWERDTGFSGSSESPGGLRLRLRTSLAPHPT